MVAVPAAQAAPPRPTAPLVVTGLGGQTAVLTVPRGGLDVGYPFFSEPRLPGPDGTVGGVVIQRPSDGRLVGGTLLLNAPGFDRALGLDLVDYGHTQLPAGRYRLTLLGSGRQEVHLAVRGATTSRRLVARGGATPITRTSAGTARTLDTWTADLGRTGGSDYVLIGAGSGGDQQQAENATMCLQATSAASGAPCLTGDGGGWITPGAGGAAGWSSMLFPPDSLPRASYTFSGNAVGVGPSSTTGHAGIVISLRR
jgi:hypothetical protein